MSVTNFESRWRFEGTLTVRTPMHVGSGEAGPRGVRNRQTGQDVQVNLVAVDHAGRPYIPGSTLKGNLRAWLTRRLNSTEAANIDILFGHHKVNDDNARGSKILVQDGFFHAATSIKPDFIPYWHTHRQTGVLARVALDRSTKTAISERLFHTEFVPAGVSFKVVIDGQNLSLDEAALLQAAFDGFNDADDPVRIGAAAGSDWGKCHWTAEPMRRILKNDVKKAMAAQSGEGIFDLCQPLPTADDSAMKALATALKRAVTPSRFECITITLKFHGPFMVNDAARVDDNDDVKSLKPRRTPDGLHVVLPAESFRGALRTQAERIVRTLDPTHAPSGDLKFTDTRLGLNLIETMFGDAGWASCFRVADAVAPARIMNQEFVAIDRFTGGVAGSAKFQAEYVESPEFTVRLHVDTARMRTKIGSGAGFGLLALTLRDLEEGDISFGFGTRKGYGACTAVIDTKLATDADLLDFRAMMAFTPSEVPQIPAIPPALAAPRIVSPAPEPNQFHNPYQFVPVKAGGRIGDLSRERFEKREFGHVTHDRYLDRSGDQPMFSGRLIARVTTQTPTVFGASQTRHHDGSTLVHNYMLHGRCAIPATTLKGLLSCVAEAASNSALRVLVNRNDGKRPLNVLDYFTQVNQELAPFGPKRKQITIAEQLFGFVEIRDTIAVHVVDQHAGSPILALAGRVRVSAGEQSDDQSIITPMNEVTLKILSSPKPPSPGLYFKRTENNDQYMKKDEFWKYRPPSAPLPRGRKIYVHDKPSSPERHATEIPDHANQKSRVAPLPKDAVFYFHIDFDNLNLDELALLCYCVRPTDAFRHKIGMGKPLGLGTVRIDPLGLYIVNRVQRYRSDALDTFRYHQVWQEVGGQHLWPRQLARERSSTTTPTQHSPFELREIFRKTMLEKKTHAVILHALELLGDPSATVAEVQYPQVIGGNETENYRWWAANEKFNDAKRRESLKSITLNTQSLPTLKKLHLR